jgi:SMC interacting uncharacterized protein involved in chromosome segregation
MGVLMDPEERCTRHENEIKELQKDMMDVKIQLTDIKADTKYIKQKLDNGLFKNLTDLNDKLSDLCPKVADHSYWIDKVKWGTATITIVAVGGGVVAILMKVISNG